MGDGLKLVNAIYDRAREQYNAPDDSFLGVNAAVLVLSDPKNIDLWKRMRDYCEEEEVQCDP